MIWEALDMSVQYRPWWTMDEAYQDHEVSRCLNCSAPILRMDCNPDFAYGVGENLWNMERPPPYCSLHCLLAAAT